MKDYLFKLLNCKEMDTSVSKFDIACVFLHFFYFVFSGSGAAHPWRADRQAAWQPRSGLTDRHRRTKEVRKGLSHKGASRAEKT